MRLQICILSLLLLAVLTVNADETLVVKITKVEDDTLTLDAGSNQGLKVGLKGHVYYEIIFGGEVKHIYIANISLIAVQSDESSAKVEEKTAAVKPGHFAEIEGVQKAKGFLYVTSSPKGADISLDGEATGKKTPAQIKVSAGSHTVEVHLRNYNPTSQSVEVAANKVTRVEFQLTRGKGALTVLSEPLEAEVYLDGKLKGSTPLTIEDIPAGEYEVQVQMEGYYPWKRQVVVDNQESAMLEAQLEKHAVLVVEVSPKGSVSIDGGPEKPAPLRLPGIPLGKHTITTRAPDFEPQTVEVTLRAGEEKRVPVTLERSRGSIEVRSSPSDATIYLDGEPQGQTPTTLELPTGEYTLELRKPQYYAATQTIQLQRGVNPSITLSLKPMRVPQPTAALRPLPKGFIGIHTGLYRPVEDVGGDIPWFLVGFDFGVRLSQFGQQGIYWLILSSTYTTGDPWVQVFARSGIRYMKYTSTTDLMFVGDLLLSITGGDLSREEIDGAGLALGVGFRYKWFELRTLSDFIRWPDTSGRENEEFDSLVKDWLGGYNLTVGLIKLNF